MLKRAFSGLVILLFVLGASPGWCSFWKRAQDRLVISGSKTYSFQALSISGNRDVFYDDNYAYSGRYRNRTNLTMIGSLMPRLSVAATLSSNRYDPFSQSVAFYYEGGRTKASVGDITASLTGNELISFSKRLRGATITQDFGTSVVIGIAAVVTLLLAGLRLRHMLLMAAPAAMGAYLFVMRSPHRLARITAMGDIWSPTNPSAYQPRQSMLAILTGGWTGKGLGNGTLKLGFLPEDSTDFIFSVLCEEWGFIGAVGLLVLVMLWIRHSWQISLDAGDRFGQVLAGSLGFLIAAQALMHIAVDTVVLPPTGISLPFVSAGGTSLILMAGAAALIVSVSARQKVKDPLA